MRRLTASAGYDSWVQCHCRWPPRRPRLLKWTNPSSAGCSRISCTSPGRRSRRRERQFEGRALDVVDQDVQVVRIDQRVLRRRVEEIRRVAHDELVERRAATPPGPPPSGSPAARRGRPAARSRRSCPGSPPARDVERADVDAQLERVGGDHAAHGPLAQPLLDLAPPLRQVAAAVAADRRPPRPARRRSAPSGSVVRISVASRLWRRRSSAGAVFRNSSATARASRDVRPPDAELPVHHRRVDEHEVLLAARRAALGHQLERLLRQRSRPARAGWRSWPTSR